MPRSATSIQAEISILEARLASDDGLVNNASSDGVSLTYEARMNLEKRLDQLYIQLGRASGQSPMFARGRLRGLNDV